MPVHFKTILLPISAAAIFALLAGNLAAQSTGPAALAAKQHIRDQVLAAMSDGKITPDERRNILSHAKDILSAKEYVGLVNTMDRLSPPDKSVPEDIGYTPVVDKQLMANFPAPDLPWITKSKLRETLSQQPIVKELMPKQWNIAKATAPKQTFIVKEIITKQTVVSAAAGDHTDANASASNQAVAKTAASKQKVVKAAASKQPAAKTAKSIAPANAPGVVIIPPPPPLDENNSRPLASTAGNAQKPAVPADPSAPLPPAEQYQTRNSAADKPIRQKLTEGLKKQPAPGDQVTIRQPASLFNVAEKSATTHFYADYSVPVLTTPAAALLSDRSSNTVQASFDEPLKPESGQSIIRR